MLRNTYSFVFGALAGVASAVAIQAITKRSRAAFILNREDFPKAIEHVVYEYSNLIHSGDYVSHESRGDPIGVHVADVFLLNCRKFRDFFSISRNYHPDVRAIHFCSVNPLPKIRLKHNYRWRGAINQNLAHISYDRVRNPIPFYDGDNTKVDQLVEELRDAFRLFLSYVDNEYEPLFQKELKERIAEVGKPLP